MVALRVRFPARTYKRVRYLRIACSDSRRAAAFSLELQLHLRRIPYRRETASSVATASRLVLPTATLLRIPDVEQVLRPDAELRCAVEEDGGRKVRAHELHLGSSCETVG